MKSAGKTPKGAGGVGGNSLWLPMPLLTASTYNFLHRTIDVAYDRLVERGDGMGMTLGGKREKPHFAHNTWRRMAAAEAEAAYARGECTAEEIDLHFGWGLKKHLRKMRLHYADRGARAVRAKITKGI
jgi:hypothetical protein